MAKYNREPAAFGRLCVETAYCLYAGNQSGSQPPSGGCVLKHIDSNSEYSYKQPAAFGRLCVETILTP